MVACTQAVQTDSDAENPPQVPVAAALRRALADAQCASRAQARADARANSTDTRAVRAERAVTQWRDKADAARREADGLAIALKRERESALAMQSERDAVTQAMSKQVRRWLKTWRI